MRRSAQTTVFFGCWLAILAYTLISLQDAAVKLLVEEHSVWQLLFLRSIFVVMITLAVGSRTGLVRRTVRSNHRLGLILRGVLILAAWLCYYTAARDLTLAQLTTIYFAAPLILTGLSVTLLGEKVPIKRWLATGVGFVGVVIASDSSAVGSFLPVGLVLAAAVLWAINNTWVRSVSAHVSSDVQVLVANCVYIVLCAPVLPLTWNPLSAWEWLGIILVAMISAGAQYALLESLRLAPASVVAPFEYTMLITSFFLSFLIWNVVPSAPVWVGAALILASGLFTIVSQFRARRP